MDGPIAYLDGRWLAADRLCLSPTDAGFVLGVAVAEQLRTFRGELFHLEEHLDRLEHSLEIVGFRPSIGRESLAEAARRLAAANHARLDDGDDLGLGIVVTPGTYAAYADGGVAGPTVLMHTYPLPFRLWAEKYEAGQSVVVTDVRQVPPECWPPGLKCRSRMHYYLADRRAEAVEPGARAVLLDAEGRLTEASTANLVIYLRSEGLISPPLERILPGISLARLSELAGRLGVSMVYRDMMPSEAAEADEILLTSTPFCLLPVTRFQGRPVGRSGPGEVYRALLAEWSRELGVDIAAQAKRFARRASAAR